VPRFYWFALRLAGARTLSTRRTSRRASYFIMGVFIALQVSPRTREPRPATLARVGFKSAHHVQSPHLGHVSGDLRADVHVERGVGRG
jgi:hypothetical protein